jgi:very-short-patch-repair endonuclease
MHRTTIPPRAPPDDGHAAPMDPTTALTRCGGAARPRRLYRLGVTRQGLRAASRRGDVVPLDGAGFALPGADPDIATAVRLGGVVSHASAARLHGFELWNPPDGLHVSVVRGRWVSEDGVIVHRRPLPPEDIDAWRPLTTPLRTALDCGRSLPFLDAVVALESGLRLGRYTPAALRAAAETALGNDTSALRRAVAHVDRMSGSVLESAAGPLLDLLGHDVRKQVLIPGVGAPVDYVIDGWLVVETDGFAFHSDRAEYRKDRRRANALAERGLVLLRFTYEDIRFHPWDVLALVAAVLRRGRAA